MFLILEHEESEGPGIFKPLLQESGLSFKRIKLLPERLCLAVRTCRAF